MCKPTPQITYAATTLMVQAATPDKIAKSQVPGYRDPAFQPASRGVPLQM